MIDLTGEMLLVACQLVGIAPAVSSGSIRAIDDVVSEWIVVTTYSEV